MALAECKYAGCTGLATGLTSTRRGSCEWMDNFQVAMSGDLNWVEGDKGKFFPLSKYFMLAIDDKQHVRHATHCADAAAARCPHAARRAGYRIMMLSGLATLPARRGPQGGAVPRGGRSNPWTRAAPVGAWCSALRLACTLLRRVRGGRTSVTRRTCGRP